MNILKRIFSTKNKKGADAPSFFSAEHPRNRELFASTEMSTILDKFIRTENMDDVYDMQYYISKTLQSYRENKQKIKLEIPDFITAPSVVSFNTITVLKNNPFFTLRVKNCTHPEDASSFSIDFSTSFKNEEYTINYYCGTLWIRSMTTKSANTHLYLPVLKDEGEYFQMKVLHPWLVMSYEDYTLFFDIIKECTTRAYMSRRFTNFRIAGCITRALVILLTYSVRKRQYLVK